nr:hypothetical protein [Tanacetum cinerariifolium]
ENKRKRLMEISTKAKYEVLTLGLWYLELALLYSFKFEGRYRSRVSASKWAGSDEENVPWRARRCARSRPGGLHRPAGGLRRLGAVVGNAPRTRPRQRRHLRRGARPDDGPARGAGPPRNRGNPAARGLHARNPARHPRPGLRPRGGGVRRLARAGATARAAQERRQGPPQRPEESAHRNHLDSVDLRAAVLQLGLRGGGAVAGLVRGAVQPAPRRSAYALDGAGHAPAARARRGCLLGPRH